jgi:hypothetical protein
MAFFHIDILLATGNPASNSGPVQIAMIVEATVL